MPQQAAPGPAPPDCCGRPPGRSAPPQQQQPWPAAPPGHGGAVRISPRSGLACGRRRCVGIKHVIGQGFPSSSSTAASKNPRSCPSAVADPWASHQPAASRCRHHRHGIHRPLDSPPSRAGGGRQRRRNGCDGPGGLHGRADADGKGAIHLRPAPTPGPRNRHGSLTPSASFWPLPPRGPAAWRRRRASLALPLAVLCPRGLAPIHGPVEARCGDWPIASFPLGMGSWALPAALWQRQQPGAERSAAA